MREEKGAKLDRELRALLGLAVPPIAIVFAQAARADGAMPAPTSEGRIGAVSSGRMLSRVRTGMSNNEVAKRFQQASA